MEIAASDVMLDCRGHELSGSGETSSETAGISIAGSPEAPLSGVSVENCSISAHQFGLYAGHLEGGALSNNVAIRNQRIGFYLIGLSQVMLSGNIAEGNDPDGFLLIGSHEVTVSDNAALYNRMRGITFEGCQYCLAVGNESHSHGVLGFGIYGSSGMTLENNVAHDNRYHGFAILHDAVSATFRGNESYANGGAGFFLEGSQDNHYTGNVSHDNTLDGIVLFRDSHSNTFEGNTLRDNGGYGAFSDEPIESAIFSGNTFSGNDLGETGSSDPETIDWCSYTGFGAQGPCDPVFEGGPNLKDPANAQGAEVSGGVRVVSAEVVEDALVTFPRFGDLWMNTWAENDNVYMSFGDGTAGDCFPVCEPQSGCQPPDPGFDLWCATFDCTQSCVEQCQMTDAGLLELSGEVPEFSGCEASRSCLVSTHVPSQPTGWACDPSSRDDKPSSLLALDGKIVWSGHVWTHSDEGERVTYGYLAWSEDDGRTWTEVPDSPWQGEAGMFRVMMFINVGRGYELNTDGYVYALGMGSEAGWAEQSVYLARVPREDILDYGSYEYYTGMSGGEPTWSSIPTQATPLEGIRSDMQGSAIYHPGIQQYVYFTSPTGQLYVAPQPWGPWRLVANNLFPGSLFEPRYGEYGYIPGIISKGTEPDAFWFTITGPYETKYNLRIGKIRFQLE
jgi:parallel beta-helix repeat protein